MLITITQFRDVAASPNGVPLPMGEGCSGFEELTAAGASAAMADGTTMVRVATDTKVQVDAADTGDSGELLHANTTEWFAVNPGQVLTFTEPA